MNFDKILAFNNKIVVVTGGASGIGEAISKAFAAQGATVAVVDFE
jgi:NAD(P)-dependent dehydrogenase (short-subunit alcohol dehydrogenase family)